jgi:phage major head subunit gpT-like protein
VIANQANLTRIFVAFKALFQEGFDGADKLAARLATKTMSGTTEELYGWLGQFPSMREWLGDRVVKGLAAQHYTIINRRFESTIGVPRTSIEDDRYGAFAPVLREMGRSAAEHPDQMLLELLAAGFTTPCYDGQPFFDTDHPVGENGGDYPVRSVSNSGGGSGDPWFLLDLNRPIKPLIWQERTPYTLQSLTEDSDEHVFMRDEYIYGVRARANAGYGLWQLAFGSKQTLDKGAYAAARVAMRSLRGDNGRPLGVRPTHLVVPPSLEEAALEILNAERDAAGATNVWKGTAEVIVSEWIA